LFPGAANNAMLPAATELQGREAPGLCGFPAIFLLITWPL